MVHAFETDGSKLLHGRRWFSERGVPQFWIVLPLLFGLVLGSVVGLFSSLPAGLASLLEPETGGRVGLHALWLTFCFPVSALLLATSFLGFTLLPALSGFCGFLLGGCVAAALRANGYSGLLAAFVSTGIPAFFILPAFLLAASDSAMCSLQLLRCFARGEHRPPDGQGEFPRHLAVIVMLCAAQALYSVFVLPMLLNVISQRFSAAAVF